MAEGGGVHLVLRAGALGSGALLVLGLAGNALGLGGGPLLSAGLVVLVATPVLRVLFLTVSFARARDWRMTAVSLAVLALLGLAAALGA